MSEERIQAIVDAIGMYPDTDELMGMTPAEAVKALNALGNNFTEEELDFMREAMVSVRTTADGELDADQLESVSGGMSTQQKLLIAQGVCCAAGWWCIAAAACCW